MSEIRNWQFIKLAPSNRDKLTKIVISEIIFLKKIREKSHNKKLDRIIGKSIRKLNKLFSIINNHPSEISQKEFNYYVSEIFKILKRVYIRIK